MGSITDPSLGWRHLNVGVVGGGIGGMSVAIALRRAGHSVTIYERNDFAGEVGASVSCAANGARWLHEWGVDVEQGDPVVLKKLINRDWNTGEPVSVFSLDDYKKKWGYEYYMFHRQYMHKMLMDCALKEEGEGEPAKLNVNYKVSQAHIPVITRPQLIFKSSARALTSKLAPLPSQMVIQLDMTSSLAPTE